jgi:S1-C subfamily serine protease
VRPSALATLSVVSAVLGGIAVLLVGHAAGWLGQRTTRTVVISDPAPVVGTSAPVGNPSAKPLSGNGFDPARIYARRSAGVVTIYAFLGSSTGGGTAQGSGFVVSRDGYILTNSHVITSAGEGGIGSTPEPAREVYVQFKDRDRVRARIIGWDVFDDVGLLRVDPKAHALAPLPLGDSGRVRVGEPVAAIGSPFGNEGSLAVGVVSAVRRSIRSLTSSYNLTDAIQIDAPINHGNSGGPLFDARGNVIGINAQIRSDSGNAEGVGFAVPINSARRSMRELIATGRVAYAYVGITTEDLTPSLARRFDYPVLHGAIVDSVRPGTAGDRAGLRGGTREIDVNGTTFTTGGDLIVAIAGRPVRNAEDLVRVVTQHLHPGQTAFFTLFRDGRKLRLPVTLEERPAVPEIGR